MTPEDVYLPRHLNQFRNPRGDQWAGQIESGGCDCWATVGAMMVRAGTRGRRTPTPPDIRHWSRNPLCPGHIGYIQTAAAHYGVDVEIPHHTATGWGLAVPWVEVLTRLNHGQFAALAIHYGALPSDARAKTSFRGNHMVMLCPRTDRDQEGGMVRADDPLREHRLSYRAYDLRAAAFDLARQYHFPYGNVIAAFSEGIAR